MDLAVEQAGAVSVVAVKGRIDGSNAREFEEKLMAGIGAHETSVVLDMSTLDYISSAGLRVFLVVAKHLQEADRGFALCSLSAEVGEVFEITGFNSIINIHDDRDAAVSAVSG